MFVVKVLSIVVLSLLFNLKSHEVHGQAQRECARFPSAQRGYVNVYCKCNQSPSSVSVLYVTSSTKRKISIRR